MDDTLIELWIMMADRVSPQLCYIHPSHMTALIQEAVRLFSPFRHEIDAAVENLQYIISHAPADSFAFRQAEELLNIIDWQRHYHPDWNAESHQLRHIRSGRCGEDIAHALALMQAGADKEVLQLTQKIIEEGDPTSDDLIMTRLIRAASYICSGNPDEGEKEIMNLYVIPD